MKVFLSWSGETSRGVALAIRDWLPLVIQEVDPFVSARDIQAGARWLAEISGELEASNFGIVCVTRENQDAPWLNFEAGALAKAVGASRVVPLAIDLTVSDVRLPLGQFQAMPATNEGIAELLASLNSGCEKVLESGQLAKAVEVWWPHLEPQLDTARRSKIDLLKPERADRELLEEILTTVRGLQAHSSAPDSPRPRLYTNKTDLAVDRFADVVTELLPNERFELDRTRGRAIGIRTLSTLDQDQKEALRREANKFGLQLDKFEVLFLPSSDFYATLEVD